MLTQPESIIVPAGQGSSFWISDDRGVAKLSGAQSAGRISVTEVVVPPGGGPPPHRHAREDESFYVLEGQVQFVFGNHAVNAAAGDFVFAPRNVTHRFFNLSSGPARLLLTVTPPGNFEAFARECGVRWQGDDRPPRDAIIAGLQRMGLRATEFGTEMLPDHLAAGVGTLPPRTRALNVLGDPVEILVDSSATESQFGVSLVHSRPGGGPPPHVHDEMDEAFYVLDGEIEVPANGTWTTLAPGSLAYSPPGTVHTYRDRSARPAKFLAYHTHGTLDAMFAELDTLAMPPDLGKVVEICSRHDTRFVSP